MSDSADLPRAGVWRRLAAMFYDCMLLAGVLFGAILIPGLFIHTDTQTINDGDVTHDIQPMLEGPLFQLYLLTIITLFFIIFWRKNGQTLGMQAWRLQLQNMNGERPGWGQCLLRLMAAIPSIALGGMGYWWVWLNQEKLSWHDKLSRTQVVVLPKR